MKLLGLRTQVADLEEQLLPLDVRIVQARNTLNSYASTDDQAVEDIATEFPAIQRVFDAPAAGQPNSGGITVSVENHLAGYRAAYQSTPRARDDLAEVERAELDEERRAEVALVDLRERKEERRVELTRLRAEQRRAERVVEQRIDELQARVEELEDRQEGARTTLVFDGQVLQARVTAGFVIIDRGLDHDLRTGTRFQVYNRVGGRNLIKGEVEVVRVEQRMALTRVIEEVSPDHPIIPGDHLHNPIYNSDETKVFVIKGEFERFNHAELARFIREIGGRVDNDISTESHYLVAGDNAAEALESARLYGVTIMSEDQLMDFVRREERFTVRGGMMFAVVGEFTAVPRERIEAWVEANGGVVSDQLTDGTNVLITGEGAVDAITRARLSGITIVNQRELLGLASSNVGDDR